MKDIDFKRYIILLNNRQNDLLYTLGNLKKENLNDNQKEFILKFFENIKKDCNDFAKEMLWEDTQF